MGLWYVCGLSCLRDHLSPGVGSFDRGWSLTVQCVRCPQDPSTLHFPLTTLLKYHTFKADANHKHCDSVFPLVYQQPHSAVWKLQMNRTKSLTLLVGKVIASTSCVAGTRAQAPSTQGAHTSQWCCRNIFILPENNGHFRRTWGWLGYWQAHRCHLRAEAALRKSLPLSWFLLKHLNKWLPGGPKELDTGI